MNKIKHKNETKIKITTYQELLILVADAAAYFEGKGQGSGFATIAARYRNAANNANKEILK